MGTFSNHGSLCSKNSTQMLLQVLPQFHEMRLYEMFCPFLKLSLVNYVPVMLPWLVKMSGTNIWGTRGSVKEVIRCSWDFCKGSLISESFSLWLKSQKKMPNHSTALSTWRKDPQESDLALFFWVLSQSEKLPEIKPPLVQTAVHRKSFISPIGLH